jgi:co-chaperonin GroES (HSP10)
MHAKMIKTSHAEYEPQDYDGNNKSGYDAYGNFVILLPDKPKGITSGGVHLPDDQIEREFMGVETGVIVACGEDAFKFTQTGFKLNGRVPQVGDRVFMERYGGRPLLGKDGQRYRVVADNTIGAIEKE